MAQISRPFQIALGGVLVLALVWIFAVRAHESNPSQAASVSAPAPRTVSKSAREAAARREATRRAAAHKHAVVTHKTVLATHKTVTHKTVTHTTVVAAHKTSATSSKTVVVTHRTTTRTHKSTSVSHKTVVPSTGHAVSRSGVHPDRTAAGRHARPAEQITVEAELAHGKTVMLVFWNPHSSVDQEVHSQAGALVSGSKGTVVMHSALASQVNIFGSITEVVRVYQTPTILIVNRHGVVSTLTGLTEVFALQQAVREAQHASH
jgi:hypothetical protein